MKNEFHKELLPYEVALKATLKPVNRIKAKRSATSLFESKFGGYPYLPKDMEHPKDERGNPMVLLAQINFADMPPLEDYPESGILQFFLSQDDDMIGMDTETDTQTTQKNFRVVYHESLLPDESHLVTNFDYLRKPTEDDYLPFEGEMGLSFEQDEEIVSIADYQMDTLIGNQIDFDQKTEDDKYLDLWDLYSVRHGGEGHKVGGYAAFTQEDPRTHLDESGNFDALLLQIDTDDDNEIMWGDCGVGNFFIKKEDLKNRNFESVMYNWDCC